MAPPSCGLFGIKLVGEIHPQFPFFGRAGTPAVMNFPNTHEGRQIAASVPIGHRSLVYLMHPVMRFWAAIEYIRGNPDISDVLEDGRQAAAAQNADAILEAVNPRFARVWRCIRVVAVIDDPMQAPTPNFGFQQGEIMRDISEQEYLDLYNEIPWSWESEDH
jgi:hypothetical protein